MLVLTVRDTRNNTKFTIESRPIMMGGNGAVAIFFAKHTCLNEDFVLKTNSRKEIKFSSRELEQYFEHKRVVVPCFETKLLIPSVQETYLHGTYLPTCYYHGELCVIERVDDKYTEDLKQDKLKALLQGGPEVTLLRGAAEYSRLRTKLWEHVKQRPMIRHSMSWSSTPPSTVKVTLIGPLCPLGDSLVIVKSRTLYSSVSELNGPGLLPSVCISLSRGANDKWLKMPYGNCFDSIDKFPNESDMYMIAKRLARANQTLLQMSPRRYCGDNKPSNVCFWDSPNGGTYYMLDTDEIPTLEALWEGGGPRHYATFQLAGDLFSNSATLMVLYSWMATVACFCSKSNMEWVYTQTVHTQHHLPHTVQALINATKCPPKIDRIFSEAAELAESDPAPEMLISFFDSVQSIIDEDPPTKRRRLRCTD